jgi:hypothetical protein
MCAVHHHQEQTMTHQITTDHYPGEEYVAPEATSVVTHHNDAELPCSD